MMIAYKNNEQKLYCLRKQTPNVNELNSIILMMKKMRFILDDVIFRIFIFKKVTKAFRFLKNQKRF